MAYGGPRRFRRGADGRHAVGRKHQTDRLSLERSRTSGFHESFQQGLRELGWVAGQNIEIEYRFADGRFERLPELAAELVRLKVDMIVAQPITATQAAKNATSTIPIVMINVQAPDRLGLVDSLARPGAT